MLVSTRWSHHAGKRHVPPTAPRRMSAAGGATVTRCSSGASCSVTDPERERVRERRPDLPRIFRTIRWLVLGGYVPIQVVLVNFTWGPIVKP